MQRTDLEERTVQLIDEIQAGLERIGPEAAEATVRGVHWEGMFAVIGGLISLALLAAFLPLMVRFIRKAIGASPTEFPQYAVPALIFGSLSLLFFLTALVALIEPGHWIAAFDPEAAIARDVLEALK